MGYVLDKPRVLVVEPNSYMRDLLRTILQSVDNVTIDLTGDGEVGFARYCRHEYDVVFTDSETAPITGLGLVNLIRKSPDSPNPYVPIVMLSAHSDEERVKLARDHGVTEFIAKPFSADCVLTHLEEVIENPRSFVRAASYFGPDRRRNASLDYAGGERRRSTLKAISLSRRDIAEQQAARSKDEGKFDA